MFHFISGTFQREGSASASHESPRVPKNCGKISAYYMNSVSMQDALLCALLSRPYEKFLWTLIFKNRTNLRPNRASSGHATPVLRVWVCDDILSFLVWVKLLAALMRGMRLTRP